jgi:hypothetical protein
MINETHTAQRAMQTAPERPKAPPAVRAPAMGNVIAFPRARRESVA